MNLLSPHCESAMFSRTCLRSLRPLPARRSCRANPSSSLTRLLSTLAILESKSGALQPPSLATITAAQKLGGTVHALIAGSQASNAASTAAKVPGIEKILSIDNDAYERGLPENLAPMLLDNIKKGNYTHIIALHSAFGKNLLPRIAALADMQMISDVSGIEGEDTFVRPIYAGNAILTVKSEDSIKMFTVRGTSFAAPELDEAAEAKAEIVQGSDPNSPTLGTEFVSEDLTTSERPDLGSASRVVSGGRGLKSKEQFDKVLTPLADALGAAIGASRAAVDSGFADNSLQVGQTGKNVAPQLYLCAGVSGAIQHLAGMKDSKVIAAINKDADAPIFQVADVGLVADLFQAVPEMTEKVKGA